MIALYDSVAVQCSKLTTNTYSTSFSLGVNLLDKKYHCGIYSIYGFVRFADEIVDSFHDFDKEFLLDKFEHDTNEAIQHGISMNPILHAFQSSVREYGIDREHIDTFLASMRMDLTNQAYSRQGFDQYILGSAEVVGLMCLRVFTKGDNTLYAELKPYAMRLGAAFQKVNFLRDLKSDLGELGRCYFPDLELEEFNIHDKKRIEAEILEDFKVAMQGIRKLPPGARRGVYVAYVYYRKLFEKIQSTSPEKLLRGRIRIPNALKFTLMVNSLARLSVNAI